MISVITPCKNIISEGRREFFVKMMTSLQEQTYRDYEHIVVDSCSLDGTQDLLKQYEANGEIDRLIVEKDNNLHEAMNKGLWEAQGEYIHIMNSDNYFASSDFFEVSLSALMETHYDFTHGDRMIIRRDNGPATIKKGDESVAFFRMPFRYQTMLIRRELYDQFGPLDEQYEIASDYKFMLTMLLAGKKGFYFPRVFIYSLDGGITSDREKCIKEVTQVLYEVYGEEHGLSIEDCRNIYLRRISSRLMDKISTHIQNPVIRKSLMHCYKEGSTV